MYYRYCVESEADRPLNKEKNHSGLGSLCCLCVVLDFALSAHGVP